MTVSGAGTSPQNLCVSTGTASGFGGSAFDTCSRSARRSYRRRSYLKMTSRTEEIGSASSTYRLKPYLPFRFRGNFVNACAWFLLATKSSRGIRS
jgi:hypothetical protein